MFGGGKNKVACPQCGAKNPAGQRRCRVCTAIIDAGADEGDRGFMGPGGRAEPAPAAAPPVDDGSFGIAFDSGPSGAPAPAEPVAEVDPADAIVIDAPPRNPDTAPPPPLSDETWDPNWLDDIRD